MAERHAHLPIRTIEDTFSGTYENPHLSTRNRTWDLAVAIPLTNPHLLKPKLVSYVITSQDDITVIFDCGTSNDATVIHKALLRLIQQRKIYCQLAKTDRTAIENKQVATIYSINSTSITIKLSSSPLYDYSAGSYITFTLNNFADGWSISGAIEPVSIRKTLISHITNMVGDFFAQELYIPYGSYNTAEKLFYQFVDLSTAWIPKGSQLRIGCVFNIKMLNSSGFELVSPVGDIRMFWNRGGSKEYIGSLIDNSYGDIYTVFNSNAMRKPDTEIPSLGFSFINLSGTDAAVRFWVDEIWAEHDAGFGSGGYVNVGNYPVRSSLGYTDSDDISLDRLANGDYFLYTDFGNANESSKWIIESEWQFCTVDTYNKFKMMESFCRDGYLINLHSKLPEVPEVLTGKLVVKDLNKSTFDFTKSNFKVTFQEV